MGSTYFTKRCKSALGQKAKGRKKRAKTFKSLDAANEWAKANKISDYTLENLRTEASPKIRIKQ